MQSRESLTSCSAMVGKQISGKSFGGCIKYVLNRKEAILLEAKDIRVQNLNQMIKDFNIRRSMNPNLGKAVGHLVLSWSKEDQRLLSPTIMAERAREYLKLMEIKNTQYIIVQHTDREHPHLHIVYNRVDNNGKTISDSNNFKKNVKACKEITLKYGYHMGEGKQAVNRGKLKGKEQVRYELFDAISKAAKTSTNWKDLEDTLIRQGIIIQYKYRSGTMEVQGISFSKGELKMKGSAIDRSCSYTNLNKQLEINHEIREQAHQQFVNDLKEVIANSQAQREIEVAEIIAEAPIYSGTILFDFIEDLGHAAGSGTDDDERRRKKRNNEGYSR
jgi:hypothetical protein